jgi:hypothetical protein
LKKPHCVHLSLTFPLILARLSDKRAPIKTPKSRLATEAKAEFTKVNEHFADGA